jgi:NAD(P)-dependent dehydrogenase (short-subunit alcohol dehydrogenase family)
MTFDPNPALLGSVAVVTGGGRGIGYGIATVLADMGATLVITGGDEKRVAAAAHKLSSHGRGCEGIVCDVTDLDSVTGVGERLRNNYGRVDILVNNAGIGGSPSL